MQSWPVGASPALIVVAQDNSVLLGLPRGANLNHSAHDQSLDYGVRDWWRLSGVIKLKNPDDADFRVARTAVENIFVLRPVDDKRPFDLGVGWFAAVDASLVRAAETRE